MHQITEMVTQYRIHFAEHCVRPEYRHIEPYSRPKRLNFQNPAGGGHRRLPGSLVLALTSAYALLADWQESQNPELASLGSWARYLALPKQTATEKRMAEIFRVLRVFRLSATQAGGLIEIRDDGLIRASCTYNSCGLSLLVTRAGLELLVSSVAWFMDSLSQPHSEAYAECMLLQYFSDLTDEIRGFADDDRILFQFRQPAWFNRHFRLEFDNPRVQREGDLYRIDAGKYGQDPLRYPIDFYLSLDNDLFIVPVEALHDGCLAVADLPKWRARLPGGAVLPDAFRQRFGHEKNVVGLPMT